MASEAQLAANRRNAAKSTGPKTARGKAAVGRNALRHGLTAGRTLCFDETEAAFTAFAEGLRAALAPADPVEVRLVEHIVLCAWRLRRAERIDAALLNGFESLALRFSAADVPRMLAAAMREMNALSRHEASLDRAFYQAYSMLERRRAERRDEIYKTKPIFFAESAVGDETNPIAHAAITTG